MDVLGPIWPVGEAFAVVFLAWQEPGCCDVVILLVS
jgi:hypothetical protein